MTWNCEKVTSSFAPDLGADIQGFKLMPISVTRTIVSMVLVIKKMQMTKLQGVFYWSRPKSIMLTMVLRMIIL